MNEVSFPFLVLEFDTPNMKLSDKIGTQTLRLARFALPS